MALWANWIMAGLALTGTGAALALRIGMRQTAREMLRRQEQLLRLPVAARSRPFGIGELAQLPVPVARYLRYALRDGQAAVRVARYRQRGTLRIAPGSKRWLQFDAQQAIVPSAHSFLWNARVGLAPLLHLHAQDAYCAGQGSARISLLSAMTVAESQPCIELNAASLHRYLAEAVWYPTALLPSAGVVWSAIDEQRALATLSNAGITVSLEFRFNAAGEVVAVHTPARWRSVKDGFELMPWEGRFRDYQEIAGMRVPVEAEAGWYVADQWHAVWKAQIRDIAYEFPSI
ncbi:MAG: DUF6920 family protein [Noviherbaspirillum sp.]